MDTELYNLIKQLFNDLEGEFNYNGKTIKFVTDKNEDYVAGYGLAIINDEGEWEDVITIESLCLSGWGDILEKNVLKDIYDEVEKLL